jgi:hypothetical protein
MANLDRPVSAYWTASEGSCLDAGKVGLAMVCINCFADLLTITLPIPIILRLRMPPSKKIGNVILFALASLVMAAGAIRAYYTWKALIGTYDETWYSVPLWVAATVELQLAVVWRHAGKRSCLTIPDCDVHCSSAPSLQTLLSVLPQPHSVRRQQQVLVFSPARQTELRQDQNRLQGRGNGCKAFQA